MIQEYEEPPLGPTQIRIKTEFASPKHGTELVGYRNDPVANRPYDFAWGANIPLPPEVGCRVSRAARQHGGRHGHRDRSRGDAFRRRGSRLRPLPDPRDADGRRIGADLLPEGLSPEAAVCLDPLVMALAMRDAGIKLGDRVAIFGLGAIGLFAVQLAKAAGADWVVAVDPLENRRELATRFGADVVIDPFASDGDVGMAIRRLTGPAPDPIPRAQTRITGGYRSARRRPASSGWTSRSKPQAACRRCTRRSAPRASAARSHGFLLWEGCDRALSRRRVPRQPAQPHFGPRRDPSGRDAPVWDLKRLVDLALAWLVSGRMRTEASSPRSSASTTAPKRTGPSTNGRRSRSSWGYDSKR